jgi:hypothetical protein
MWRIASATQHVLISRAFHQIARREMRGVQKGVILT